MENKTAAIVIFGLLGLGLILLLTRKHEPLAESYYSEPEPVNLGRIKLRPLPDEKATLMAQGGHRYLNKEVKEIEWNSEGLPVKITIYRDAVQT